jgi:hypothetical protein
MKQNECQKGQRKIRSLNMLEKSNGIQRVEGGKEVKKATILYKT